MGRQEKSLEVCWSWPEPACESQLYAAPSNSASVKSCWLPETALANIYTMEINNCYKSGLFFPLENQFNSTSLEATIQNSRQRDKKMMNA